MQIQANTLNPGEILSFPGHQAAILALAAQDSGYAADIELEYAPYDATYKVGDIIESPFGRLRIVS